MVCIISIFILFFPHKTEYLVMTAETTIQVQKVGFLSAKGQTEGGEGDDSK